VEEWNSLIFNQPASFPELSVHLSRVFYVKSGSQKKTKRELLEQKTFYRPYVLTITQHKHCQNTESKGWRNTCGKKVI